MRWEIVGLRPTQKSICTGVEMFRKLLDEGQAGEQRGVLLAGHEAARKSSVGRCWPSLGASPRTRSLSARCTWLTKEEGGRHTPFFKGYRPQFYFRTTDVTGTIELPGDTEMVVPGDNIKMTVDLISPIRDGRGLRLCDPRGRQDRRRRRRGQDPQVVMPQAGET